MDIFVEQLVKKRRTGLDYLRIVACIFGAFILLLIMVMGMAIKGIGFIIFVACCALIYLLYLLITATNLEYEYCFTNGALDVDKIINVRSRKRLTEVNVRKIDMMASNKNREFKRFLEDRNVKKIYACTHPQDDGVFFIRYQDDNGSKMLIFNPNDKIKEGIRRYNPQKVFLND